MSILPPRLLRVLLNLLLLLQVLPLLADDPRPQVKRGDTFPWRVEAIANLNVREQPSENSTILGMIPKGTQFDARNQQTMYWLEIRFNGRRAYVSSKYIRFLYQLPSGMNAGKSARPAGKKVDAPASSGFQGTLHSIWKILRFILIAGAIILAIAFMEELAEVGIFFGLFYLVGGLITRILFHNWAVGGWIGVGVAVLIIARVLWEEYGLNTTYVGGLFSKLLGGIYFIVSLVPFILNRLQHVLSSPWRYFFKKNVDSEETKDFLRPFFGILTIPLYIALTPLRLINAIYYNVVVHGLVGMYDFMLEVFNPCSREEGAGDFWKWLLYLPWRFIKYVLGHGLFLFLESVGWTVIDVFVPAVTLYHGTDLTAAQCIVGCSKRNKYLKYALGKDHGTFRASDDSWAGIGVYFASWRWVANSYAKHRNLSDNNPVTIVARVSLGKTLNMATAPWAVYGAIGRYGNPATLNRYAETHGYITGEWYNGSYWEYCLFDWQNLYNERWRIRPLYVFNHRTGFIQHIMGGMAHWTADF